MTAIERLRMLIHDKAGSVFSDAELVEILKETSDLYVEPEESDPEDPLGGFELNVYRAAVQCLTIVQANPVRMQSYNRGGVSWTRTDLGRAVEQYRSAAGDGLSTTTVAKVY